MVTQRIQTINITVSALQATVSAPRPTVYPTQPPPPPAYYYPATVTVIAPPPPSVPCNQFSFVRDLSIPDGSYMKPNERFTKIWQVQNTGSCMSVLAVMAEL